MCEIEHPIIPPFEIDWDAHKGFLNSLQGSIPKLIAVPKPLQIREEKISTLQVNLENKKTPIKNLKWESGKMVSFSAPKSKFGTPKPFGK